MKNKNTSIWFKISIISFVLTAIFVVVVFFVMQDLVVAAHKEVMPKIQYNSTKE